MRIFMGATFVYAGIQHLTDPSYFDSSKPGYIGHLISQYAVGSPIHDLLLSTVAPNAITVGYVVAVAETVVGAAILLGLLFRVATLAGLLLNFTFFLSATWNAFPFYFGSDIVFVMCWLTLLLTGPQQGLSVDSRIASRFPRMSWLVRTTGMAAPSTVTPSVVPEAKTEVPIPARAKLYPRQVSEVNRAFERIRQQFVSHEETQTILEFVRAFVISLGVDRNDSKKLLTGLQGLVNRETWEQSQ
jgi:thiosulfate dehydrogenase [quinone] large subunit